ncbi:hypothetical protein [Actinomadura rugatobispora]|uniref:Uncharacterized protein n=1 Tax=Actinomadura rugatobispora TaxID=1994 RepID=A0ABW1A1Q5_9ACTN|nr:hypothetical protein GCM10010200_062240 [Actinomadura rugatobispora]
MGERDIAGGGEIRIVGAERPDGLELRTRGLAAHGVPELRVSGLAPYLGQGWARVLAALAGRLAARDAPDGGGGVPEAVELGPEVTVGLVADGDDLVPVPPRGFTGRDEEWRREVLLALFPSAHA